MSKKQPCSFCKVKSSSIPTHVAKHHKLHLILSDKAKQPPAVYAVCKRDKAASHLRCPIQGCSSSFQENRKMYEHLCEDHDAPGGLGLTNIDTLPEGVSWPFPPFAPLNSPAGSRTLALLRPPPPPPDSPDPGEEMADISDEEPDQHDPPGISLFTDSSRANSSSPPQSPSARDLSPLPLSTSSNQDFQHLQDDDEDDDDDDIYASKTPLARFDPLVQTPSPVLAAPSPCRLRSSSRVPQATISQVDDSRPHPENLSPFSDHDDNSEVQGPTLAETGRSSTVSCELECDHCGMASSSAEGLNSHILRFHRLFLVLSDKATYPPTHYGVCQRDSNDSPLLCFIGGCNVSHQDNRKMLAHLIHAHQAPASLRLQNMDALPAGMSLPSSSEPLSPLASTSRGSNFITTSDTTPEPALEFPSSPDGPTPKEPPFTSSWDSTPSPGAPLPPDSPDPGPTPARRVFLTTRRDASSNRSDDEVENLLTPQRLQPQRPNSDNDNDDIHKALPGVPRDEPTTPTPAQRSYPSIHLDTPSDRYLNAATVPSPSPRRLRDHHTATSNQPDISSESEDDEGNASNAECEGQTGDEEEDRYGLKGISPVLEKAGLRVVQPRCLQSYSRPLLLICRTCRKGVSNVSHATLSKSKKGHGLKLDKNTKTSMTAWQMKYHPHLLNTRCLDVPQPANRPAPIIGLKLNTGLLCTTCGHCGGLSSLQKHWGNVNRLGRCLDREVKDTKMQTFFESHVVYFAVNQHLDGQDSDQPSLFNLYLGRFEDEMEAVLKRQILPPRSENEISPLLRVMLWHEHLEPFLIDSQASSSSSSNDGSLPDDDGPMYSREKVDSLRSVIALPRRLHERIPLRLVTFAYLSKVKREFKLCDPRIKRMLTEYPHSDKSEMWRMVDDQSLHTYGLILRKLVYGVFASCDDPSHPSGYSFPLSDDDRSRAAEFKEALARFAAELDEEDQQDGCEVLEDNEVLEDEGILEEDEDEVLEDPATEGEKVADKSGVVVSDGLVDTFHRLIKPFLYPRSSSSHSRWDDTLECHIALLSLGRKGNFKAAEEISQPLASLHYLMRSAMFYEALSQWKTSTGDLDDFVEREASINIKPSARSRYNTIQQHQAFVTALALAPHQSPTARVDPDGLRVTYRKTSLIISDWREGQERNLAECEKEASELCMGFKPEVKEHNEDDWPDKTRGAGWGGKDVFLDNPRCLFKALINDPSSEFAIANAQGEIELNIPAMSEKLNRCNKLGQKIAHSSLCTPGQLPRISEFADYRLVNGTMRGRNLFRDGDDIWLVNRRTKTETQVGQESFIPTKCYPRLSSLLEQYFLVIRPLERELAYHVYGKQSSQIYSEYLWVREGKKTTPRSMYKEVKEFLKDYCKIDAGIKVYRQICVEIGRTFIGSEFEIVEGGLEALSAQRGHSLRTEQVQYAPEVHHLPAMSSDLLLRFGRISEVWWEVLGLKPNSPPLLPLRHRVKTIAKAQEDLLLKIDQLRTELREMRR